MHTEQRAGNAKAAESLLAKGLQVRPSKPQCMLAAASGAARGGMPCPPAEILQLLVQFHPGPLCLKLHLSAVQEAASADTCRPAVLLVIFCCVQECGSSGRLWAEAISSAPRPARKQKGTEALKRCNDDPHVVAAIAQLFQARLTPCPALLRLSHTVLTSGDAPPAWLLILHAALLLM